MKKPSDEKILNYNANNKETAMRYKRVAIIGILLIMLGVIYIILYVVKHEELYNLILGISMSAAGIFFIINSYRLKYIAVNVYDHKNKKTKLN